MNLFDEILKSHGWMQFVKPIFWDGKFNKKVTKQYKISIVTTCMNRLNELKVTLPKNMENNIDYDKLEFVIIDYNSQDGVGDWIKENLQKHIDSGRLSYYRTTEPVSYSMSHSRNIGFKVATGDIICSVDGDAFVNKGFATYLNLMANQHPKMAFFAKGKKRLRGRLCFYKKEFVNILGGYDEGLTGYGSEDHDLMHRAWGSGMTMMWFGGKYHTNLPSKKHQITNFDEKDWKYTEKRNKIISAFNLYWERWYANKKKHWGKAHLTKNFKEEIDI